MVAGGGAEKWVKVVFKIKSGLVTFKENCSGTRNSKVEI